jgi:predicted DNA-binding protein (UPF0251 family)
MPTDREIAKWRAKIKPPPDPLDDNRLGVEDTRQSRRLMKISRGGFAPARRKPMFSPRNIREEQRIARAIADRAAWRQEENARRERRASWPDHPPPGVTEDQWEARRLLEVEAITQTAAAQIMGNSQKNLRKLAIKAGWQGKSRR